MRSKRANDSQNLDSLLDTMANVVGILVVILAVTQLTVGEAMKQIRSYEDEASAEHALAVERSEELALEMGVLEEELAALDERGAAQELASLRDALAQARSNPAVIELADVSAEAIAAALAQESRSTRRLEEEVASSSAQLASLRISLNQMPDIGAAKAVRLPDPRPAPRGTRPAAFFCRYGRVFRVDLDDLKQQLLDTVNNPVVARANFPDIGSAELRWKPLDPRQGRFGARLSWRQRNAGETSEEVASPRSAYRQALTALHPKRQTVLFYVWPDSYDVYLKAREIATGSGFLAGWEAYDADQESDWWQTTRMSESAISID
jgi:hypothetical protein